MNSKLSWIALGILCLTQIITGCGGGGDNQAKAPSENAQGDIAVSFLEASQQNISELDANTTIKAYKYKEQNPMTEGDFSAIKSKLNGYLGTNFTETKGTGSLSYNQTSDTRNASVLFSGGESEDLQALKVNPYSKGFVFHRSQAKYLAPGTDTKSSGGETKAVLTLDNAPEFALVHLKNMDLMPEDQYSNLTVGKVSGIGISGEDSPRIFTVYFIRELSGYTVVGNTRIVVSMAANGELVSLIRKWPELEETVSEIDEDAVKGNVLKGRDTVERIGDLLNDYHNETKVDSIDVRKTELVMYDDGKYVEPVLFATGDVNTKNGDTIEHDWIIPLLKNPKGKYEVGSGLSKSQPSDNGDEAPAIDPVPDPENSDSGGVE